MRVRPPSIIAHLNELMDRRGWLDGDDLRELARRLGEPLHRIEGVASFYPHYRRTPPPAHTIQACRDLSCALAAGPEALARLRAGAAEHQARTGESVEVHEVSCLGRCDRAPAALVHHQHPVQGPQTALRALSEPPEPPPAPATNYRLDPYPSQDQRYGALRRLAAAADPDRAAEALIAELREAGLRGMGGAGFPTATKWGFVRGAGPEGRGEKFVICNADESEPGTFKDRELLRALPHLVWEGILLAALAIRAQRGIVYIRHEYEPERRQLALELERAAPLAQALGIELEIFVSPGGYIMGEETALLEALEDRRGEPRNKPPFPGTAGLFGRPTLINNVETLAIAAAIAARGAAWWKDQGVRGCHGLKFVGISGDVAAPGVFEVPMGTTLGELIDLAGGVAGGKPLLALLPGGASSAFLPAERADTPLDFEHLRRAGSTLGSGAVIVVAEGRDLLALGINLTRFFRSESCGKCVPCRVGSEKAVQLLDELHGGQSPDPRASLDLLHDLDATMAQTSICGLGQVALTPALSLFRNFPGLLAAIPARRPSLRDRA
ncbi:MAG: NAD(P)H-dependent oxidoreductase subunit E [Nannocystis sp.]|nr:NAD(P)H-dependent oxidoreductase subunit E [Nannocystis sp.]